LESGLFNELRVKALEKIPVLSEVAWQRFEPPHPASVQGLSFACSATDPARSSMIQPVIAENHKASSVFVN
jgi:hypothetical protein